MHETTWILDTEGDGFTPSKFHCMSAGNPDGITTATSHDVMREFITSDRCKTLIMHNGQRADVLWMEKLLGVDLSAKRIIDTLPLSWALFPDLDRHGMYDWGDRLGIAKVPIDDWVNLPVEDYIHRCETDVKINLKLWDVIWGKLVSIYGNDPVNINRYIDYLSMKMRHAAEAEENRWEFDLRNAHEALVVMTAEREKRVAELRKAMPKVPIIKVRTVPKKLRKGDGSLSALGEAWFQLLAEHKLPEDTTEVEVVSGYDEPNPGSNVQLKDWLFSLGWKPETIKYVKDKDGQNKEIPQINKQKQDGGGVCNSIKKLYEKEPALASLDGLSVLNHRIPLLSGFISSSDQGFLAARVAGLTNTLRFIHSEIVNLPKVGLPFADAIRGSLIAGEGFKLVGSDMSSLEDRLKQHYIYPLDPGYVQTMLRDDYDPHLFLARSAGAITQDQYDAYIAGDKSVKPIRDVYKNGNYACQYNAYPPRLAITCGITLKKAKQLFDDYWELNWAIKEVAANQRVKELDEELWLWNPVSRFYYSLRSQNDRFSTLIQGTASFVFDRWLELCIRNGMDTLIGQFHDEHIFRIKDTPEEEELAKTRIRKAIDQLNLELNLNRELDVGIQVGYRYSEIH